MITSLFAVALVLAGAACAYFPVLGLRLTAGSTVLAFTGDTARCPHVEELATREFYADCRARLVAGGMLVVNLWGGQGHALCRAEPAGDLGCQLDQFPGQPRRLPLCSRERRAAPSPPRARARR